MDFSQPVRENYLQLKVSLKLLQCEKSINIYVFVYLYLSCKILLINTHKFLHHNYVKAFKSKTLKLFKNK